MENPTKDDLIDILQRNRISTVEVADALMKTGVQPGLDALNEGHYAVGNVAYVYTHSESNWPLHEQIQDIPEGAILYVDTFDCGQRAVLGDIVSKYLFVYKRISALVINGLARDAHRLKKENYPIWLTGVTPLGCFNKLVDENSDLLEQVNQRRQLFENSILVCDDSGVTLIGSDKINADTYRRLEFIELQEDIWYFCTDVLKWSTYETICQKKYLKHRDLLPEILLKKLEQYES